MKIRILALCLTAVMFVACSATDARAFGGPIERAVINWIRDARSNRVPRLRRVRPLQRLGAAELNTTDSEVVA